MDHGIEPKTAHFALNDDCAALRSRSARAQRATPARSAAYGDANRAYFGPSGPVFVKRIEPSSVGVNGQKTRLFEFSILVPVPHRAPLALRLCDLLRPQRPPYGYPPP